MQRCMPLCYALIFAIAACGAPARGAVKRCNSEVPVNMIYSVDSGKAFPWMRFRFRLNAAAILEGHAFPVDTIGYGYVRAVTAASNRNRNGLLVLEPREIIDGNLRVQVIADPRESAIFTPVETFGERASGYLPIPGILRTAVNQVRNGRNITIGPGFIFHVIALGDPRKMAPCRIVGN